MTLLELKEQVDQLILEGKGDYSAIRDDYGYYDIDELDVDDTDKTVLFT